MSCQNHVKKQTVTDVASHATLCPLNIKLSEGKKYKEGEGHLVHAPKDGEDQAIYLRQFWLGIKDEGCFYRGSYDRTGPLSLAVKCVRTWHSQLGDLNNEISIKIYLQSLEEDDDAILHNHVILPHTFYTNRKQERAEERYYF